MKRFFLFSLCCLATGIIPLAGNGNYVGNRAPLVGKPYMELPLTSIKPKGWLLEMLNRQKNGSTGKLDELYPAVMGLTNGWLGGAGDQWERAPYWIDGLLPLAYLLNDAELKNKVNPWIEWTLASQREDGFFGPARDGTLNVFGIQTGPAEDWWPRMVMLKVLQQYYSATDDQRVISFLTNYFQYQLRTLPVKPLNRWTDWSTYRVADNMLVVYWLYNITGDAFLLDLGNLLHRQGHPFTDMFLHTNKLGMMHSIHCVNLAQGIKEPAVYYMQDCNTDYLNAVKKAFHDIRRFHGQAQGMYGGDEAMHGNNPTQGSELCSAVELMYSLENILQITGDLSYADHLEKIAFNALPAQISDDFMTHQYFQQANQVMATRHRRNFDQDHGGTDLVFGILTGYPCCTSNMHQGWPKFTRNLWYATPDNGLAALIFSPSEVSAKVAGGVKVTIEETTAYPMNDSIRFTFDYPEVSACTFPFHLRIPAWCKQASIHINGQLYKQIAGDTVVVIHRNWTKGDILALHLPMEVQTDTWYENSISIERGPLVYALKVEEEWQEKTFKKDDILYYGGHVYREVLPKSPWNYGIVQFNPSRCNEVFQVCMDTEKQKGLFPWNPENAPIEIKAKARKIAHWQLYNEMAGPLPFSVGNAGSSPEEEITLIPYGCTTLRIAEFPLVY